MALSKKNEIFNTLYRRNFKIFTNKENFVAIKRQKMYGYNVFVVFNNTDTGYKITLFCDKDFRRIVVCKALQSIFIDKNKLDFWKIYEDIINDMREAFYHVINE